VSLKIMAQAMNATKSTDTEKLIAYFESQAEFDILKARKGYFRSWDHQLMQEAYPFTVKPKGQAKDKWDFLQFGTAVPRRTSPRADRDDQRTEHLQNVMQVFFLLEQVVNGLVLGATTC